MDYKLKVEGEYIELIQLLKLVGLAETGGQAKIIVEENKVFRNNVIETRKRAKLIPGDVIKVSKNTIYLE